MKLRCKILENKEGEKEKEKKKVHAWKIVRHSQRIYDSDLGA